jgi:hypothetical protein
MDHKSATFLFQTASWQLLGGAVRISHVIHEEVDLAESRAQHH